MALISLLSAHFLRWALSLGISRKTLKPVISEILIPFPAPKMSAAPWGLLLGAVASVEGCP